MPIVNRLNAPRLSVDTSVASAHQPEYEQHSMPHNASSSPTQASQNTDGYVENSPIPAPSDASWVTVCPSEGEYPLVILDNLHRSGSILKEVNTKLSESDATVKPIFPPLHKAKSSTLTECPSSQAPAPSPIEDLPDGSVNADHLPHSTSRAQSVMNAIHARLSAILEFTEHRNSLQETPGHGKSKRSKMFLILAGIITGGGFVYFSHNFTEDLTFLVKLFHRVSHRQNEQLLLAGRLSYLALCFRIIGYGLLFGGARLAIGHVRDALGARRRRRTQSRTIAHPRNAPLPIHRGYGPDEVQFRQRGDDRIHLMTLVILACLVSFCFWQCIAWAEVASKSELEQSMDTMADARVYLRQLRIREREWYSFVWHEAEDEHLNWGF